MTYSNTQVDAITQDVEKRIQDFMNGLSSSKDVNYYVWDHLEWTQEEWDEYIAWKHIPEKEFIKYVEEESNHAQLEKEQPMKETIRIQTSTQKEWDEKRGEYVLINKYTNTMKETASFPLQRHFTRDSRMVFSDIEWEKRQARITRADGEVVFQQDDVEFPEFWSQNATNIVASKYFRGQLGTPQRESSVLQMINRVVGTIGKWGIADGYFRGEEADVFLDELAYILVHQYAAFNSPVYFNIGVSGVPQQSAACFLIDVHDNMDDILEWYRKEALIFKSGSGSGVNVSKIRGKNEGLSGGGKASGPLSFMKAADASAGVIQSGGKTRRAAKLVVMDMDHPDIEDFIWCKALEERKARALVVMGYDDAIDGEAYATVAFQNANHSVSATDEFLQRVENGDVWCTMNRTNFEGREHNAAELFHQIAQAAWECGDPGLFFYDTVNAWNTTPGRGPILSGNPCQEVMQPPDTSCNLGALNLLKFLKDDNSFDIDSFTHVVNVMITAQEILVGRSDYPTPAIEKNSHDYRPLGLGYANLGALLMAKGLPYDSDEGRDYAASITALMTGQAYKRSAELAAIKGPFNGFEMNRQPMLNVIQLHMNHIPKKRTYMWSQANTAWCMAFAIGEKYGYRNSQVTLCQPTGTVALMMDCVTTGCEPDVALVNYKKLVGGGTIKHVNDMVPRALKTLGYDAQDISDLSVHIENYGTLEGSFLDDRFQAIFDCAFPSKPGGRAIAWEGHVKMVAALQPFLSGSLSKTCNIPNSSTVEDIERAYMMAWKLGCKTISVYRDGCKQTQVLTTQNTENVTTSMIDEALSGKDTVGTCQTCGKSHTMLMYPYGASPALVCTACMDSIHQRIQAENTGEVVDSSYWMEKIGSLQKTVEGLENYIQHNGKPKRQRLPDERKAITHKFSINNCEGYLTVGLFEDGSPGEIFLKMAKEGSTLSGFADGFACMVSMAFQYGIPLEVMATKFMHSRFEPSGWTPNADIQYTTSILDYVFRYLQQKFPQKVGLIQVYGGGPIQASVGDALPLNIVPPIAVPTDARIFNVHVSQPVMYTSHNVCPECGNFMTQNGSCFVCMTCGTNTGCS